MLIFKQKYQFCKKYCLLLLNMKHIVLQLVTFFLLFVLYSKLEVYAQLDTIQNLSLTLDELTFENIKMEENFGKMKVVSASRSSKSIEDLPVTIYIITREEILRNGYITLVDVLKSTPGMRTSQPTSAEAGETFLMRGLSGNYYAKILINNVPLQPSVVDAMPIGSQIPIRQAERIEIIYGPSSSVYGADAVTGVINIILKQTENSTFAQADVVAGTNGYNYGNFSVGGTVGKNKNFMQYSIFGSKMEFSNMNTVQRSTDVMKPISYFQQQESGYYVLYNNSYINLTDITQSIADTMNFSIQDIAPAYVGTFDSPKIGRLPQSSYMVGFQLSYKGFRYSDITMNRRIHSAVGRSTFLFLYNNPENFFGERITQRALGFDKQIDKWSFSTNFSHNQYRLDNSSSRGVTYVNGTSTVYYYSASDDISAEQLITFSPSKWAEFLVGASYQYSGNLPLTNETWQPFDEENYSAFSTKKIPDDPIYGNFGYNPLTFFSYSMFYQFYFNIKRLTIITGSRFQYNSIYGWAEKMPRFAASYKLSDRNFIRISYGKSFKAPASNVIYQSVARPSEYNPVEVYDSLSYEAIPNTDLKPEKFTAYEAGWLHLFNETVSLDISLFHNKIENLLSLSNVVVDRSKYPRVKSDNPYARTNINSPSAKSELWGLQFAFKARNLMPEYKLDAGVNFAYSDGREVFSNDSGNINKLRQMPKFITQMNVSMSPHKNVYFMFENVWMTSWLRKATQSTEMATMKYANISGYYNLDMVISFHINKQLEAYFKILNVFDNEYGGMDATGSDVDLRYNPQLRRNLRFGLSFRME